MRSALRLAILLLSSFLQIELDKWAKWVKDAGIQPE